MSRAMVWFRNDLRVHDNEALATALKDAKEVLLLYCLDPRQFRELDLGFRKTGVHRARFLLESLEDLHESCRQAGGHLMVRQGYPEDIIPELAGQYDIGQVHVQKEVTDEEIQVEKAVENALAGTDCGMHYYHGLTMYHPEDLPFDPADTPKAFKTFRHQGPNKARVRNEFPAPQKISCVPADDPFDLPTLSELDYHDELPEVARYPGGETAGLDRLQHYLFGTELLTRYKWTRNQSLGLDYSSKFSPWLAFGCLSPRRVYYAVKTYEEEVKKNISTYWLIFEMLWRDYFKFLGMKHGNAVFKKAGIFNKEVEWQYDRASFKHWCDGTTGIPFVDAHMTELNETGFMSNRGRVNVSTFLSRDLAIDWRWGAAYFESLLVDYDVTSNWLNWYYQAVVWRYTHVLWQSVKYDPKGEYIKHWLPELDKLPEGRIPTAFLLTEGEQDTYGFRLGLDYPEPVLIPDKWSRMIGRMQKEDE
ncbi:MAG: DASH family cryptochrome [Cyclobacteriaceae bacterium]